MEYNFDRPIDRTREISIKWSPQLRRQMFGADDVIPMGIADMDFETAPAVAQAIRAPGGARDLWLCLSLPGLSSGLRGLAEAPQRLGHPARLGPLYPRGEHGPGVRH